MSFNEEAQTVRGNGSSPDENWRLVLNRFLFPKEEELRFSVIRSFLDLALECAQIAGKSTPLNYAIKTIAGSEAPRKLNSRAKRMYAQEAMNLALAYPYLAPLLDEFVFDKYWHDGLKSRIGDFATSLVQLGVRKLYPDTIAHALYLALKYELTLGLKDEAMIEIIVLDDCVTNVLLWEYAKKRKRPKVKSAINKRAKDLLKIGDRRENDKHWLLIYQVWSKKELEGNGQSFLGVLKGHGFQFFFMPTAVENKVVEANVYGAPQQPEAMKA